MPLIGAFTLYENAIAHLKAPNESAFLEDGIFRVVLLNSTYTPDVLSDRYYRDIRNSELSTRRGYVAGGSIMRGVSLRDGKFTADSLVDLVNFRQTFNFIVIIRCSGVLLSPDDELLCYSECGRPVVGGGGHLTIKPHVKGIFQIFDSTED